MSPLQHKIYQFIKNFLAEHGYSPTLLEIAIGVGISPRSKSLVSRYVHKLVNSGELTFAGKGYRNISLPQPNKLQLPIEGTIAAGEPIYLTKEHGILDLNLLFGKEDSFVLTVENDCFVQDGILSGDKIICKRQSTAHEGSLAIVTIDKQCPALKRIHLSNNETVTFKSTDFTSDPITYPHKRITIEAIVIGILRLLH